MYLERGKYGAEIMLDVGLYQLDQQVACQRYRQTTIDAKNTISDFSVAFTDSLKAAFGARQVAPALV